MSQIRKVKLLQVTDGGRLLTKKHRKDGEAELVEATFNRTGKTCRIGDKTFEKVKGGANGGGTHVCKEDGNSYIIMRAAEKA